MVDIGSHNTRLDNDVRTMRLGKAIKLGLVFLRETHVEKFHVRPAERHVVVHASQFGHQERATQGVRFASKKEDHLFALQGILLLFRTTTTRVIALLSDKRVEGDTDANFARRNQFDAP